MNRHPHKRKPGSSGFTLVEVLLASVAGALILASLYGLYSRAFHLRDDATERTRHARLRARAAGALRDDLRGAFISGGDLASVLEGSNDAQGSNFPGSLKFTTAGARLNADEIGSDVQQVEYYIVNDPDGAGPQGGGLLARATERNLLAPLREDPVQTTILSGVTAMEVSFYDGQTWQTSWEVTEDNVTVPQAIRVVIRLAPVAGSQAAPPPLEIVVPWTTQPEATPTPTP